MFLEAKENERHRNYLAAFWEERNALTFRAEFLHFIEKPYIKFN